MAMRFRLGEVFRIPIEVHASWGLVFLLITWTLSVEVLPRMAPGLPGSRYWTIGAGAALVFYGSLVAHELSHSLVSRRFGLRVRRITLFFFGGVAETPDEMPSPRVEFWIAVAGPAMSLALGLGFWLLAAGAGAIGLAPAVVAALGWLGTVNAALAVFNMLPGFPMDGGRVLRAALWAWTHDIRRATRWAAALGKGFAALLIALGVWQLLAAAGVGGAWLALLGLLLWHAADESYRQVALRQAFAGVAVGALMSGAVVAMPATASLAFAMEEGFERLPFASYPVLDRGRLVGLLTRDQALAHASADRERLRVEAAMLPLAEVPTASARQPVSAVVGVLLGDGPGRLPVVEDGALVGMLSRTDVLRYLTLQLGAKGGL